VRSYLFAAGIVASLVAPAAGQVYLPIPVTGYTQDVIADAVGTASSTTTAAFDQGFDPDDNNVFFEQGNSGGAGSNGTGLPPNGTITTSARRSYQLGPISGNNSLRIINSVSSGTLTLAAPAREAALSLLLSASGSGSGMVTVNWSDSQSSIYPYQVRDWWENEPSGPPPTNVAIGGLGRVDRTTGVPYDGDLMVGAVFAIYYYDIDLTGDANYQAGALIDSLTFPWPGTGLTLNVLGVSGSFVPVPEPSSLALLGLASAVAVVACRRRLPAPSPGHSRPRPRPSA
jgi:hypothetical protein